MKTFASPHTKYMYRCLELAQMGLGNVAPNPMVGSVIVYNEKIIGEGYHQNYGESHAEVNAINSVKDKSLLKEASLYVNLEPCSHWGNTPPCAERIVKEKIKTVIIGTIDPNAKVAGKGIKILEDSGIKVVTNILNEECKELNRRFFVFHHFRRPYIILKWAQTLDGYIDLIRDKLSPVKPNWITNEIARTLVHKWRTEEDAIMLGTNTVEKDNPKLNVRDWKGNNPVRVILDKTMRLDKKFAIFDDSQKTLVFTVKELDKKFTSEFKNTEFIPINFQEKVIKQVMRKLYELNIQSVIIEGGAMLHKSFLNDNLWDEARIFIGNEFFFAGVKAAKIPGSIVNEEHVGNSQFFICRNKHY